MNIRQKYELSILIKDGKFNLDKLAETFNVNARTIRNDIVQIEDYLKNKILIWQCLENHAEGNLNQPQNPCDYGKKKTSSRQATFFLLPNGSPKAAYN